MRYSVIIPVYNRPDEVDELLQSLTAQYFKDFEVVVVEDGSSIPCKEVTDRYIDRLNIKYFSKPNSGPGQTRNYGAERSEGEYLIILDSDVILPERYFDAIEAELLASPADAFGGPDRAHDSFTDIQKAINYSMTSFFTTGGIRGGKKKMDKFYPRSFNMGVRRTVYETLGGFSKMRFGEDIDFSTVKQGLEQKLNAINLESCKPTGYVSTKESGIFSSYSDGCETAFDYKNIDKLDVNTLDKYIAQAKKAKKTDSLGKLITDYEWYFACKVSADEVKGIENGDILNVALKDSDKVIECEVVSGATLDLGVKEAVLILRSSEMDSELASMRLENIEIRFNEYTGFKVPSSAIHINDKGEKTVYALVANQVESRTGKVIYSTKDYVVFEYTPEDENSIRLYDQIITQGKDLHDGKVYT